MQQLKPNEWVLAAGGHYEGVANFWKQHGIIFHHAMADSASAESDNRAAKDGKDDLPFPKDEGREDGHFLSATTRLQSGEAYKQNHSKVTAGASQRVESSQSKGATTKLERLVQSFGCPRDQENQSAAGSGHNAAGGDTENASNDTAAKHQEGATQTTSRQPVRPKVQKGMEMPKGLAVHSQDGFDADTDAASGQEEPIGVARTFPVATSDHGYTASQVQSHAYANELPNEFFIGDVEMDGVFLDEFEMDGQTSPDAALENNQGKTEAQVENVPSGQQEGEDDKRDKGGSAVVQPAPPEKPSDAEIDAPPAQDIEQSVPVPQIPIQTVVKHVPVTMVQEAREMTVEKVVEVLFEDSTQTVVKQVPENMARRFGKQVEKVIEDSGNGWLGETAQCQQRVVGRDSPMLKQTKIGEDQPQSQPEAETYEKTVPAPQTTVKTVVKQVTEIMAQKVVEQVPDPQVQNVVENQSQIQPEAKTLEKTIPVPQMTGKTVVKQVPEIMAEKAAKKIEQERLAAKAANQRGKKGKERLTEDAAKKATKKPEKERLAPQAKQQAKEEPMAAEAAKQVDDTTLAAEAAKQEEAKLLTLFGQVHGVSNPKDIERLQTLYDEIAGLCDVP